MLWRGCERSLTSPQVFVTRIALAGGTADEIEPRVLDGTPQQLSRLERREGGMRGGRERPIDAVWASQRRRRKVHAP